MAAANPSSAARNEKEECFRLELLEVAGFEGGDCQKGL
jgi:hypothetical protein